ncbi:MAG: lytic murein transglycosylase [Bradyrhizobium sp.]|nr:MAG: lytic murein transglycosylase [Bradyrhizobium sp.]
MSAVSAHLAAKRRRSSNLSSGFRLAALCAALALAAPIALPVDPVLAHTVKPSAKSLAKAAVAKAAAAAAAAKQAQAFHEFVETLRPLAEARGVSRATFDAAFAGVSFDPRIVAHTENQAEFVEPIWVYIANAVSRERVERGRAKAEEQHSWLLKAQDAYGVDSSVLLGVWGMESAFGAFSGSDGVIRSLASLAFVHFQGDYFRDELLAALQILQEGDIAAADMKGSWAGAMGQTQFMPSSFLTYAVDFEGHGRRDIWDSSADAIGSTANYLAKHGWIAGAPWGYEVRLPPEFKLTVADSDAYAPFADFAARGVARADGGDLPKEGKAELLIPAGLSGPIFLVTPNFRTIKTYNNSTAYALGVALLGDASAGKDGLKAQWPKRDKELGENDVREMQRELKKRGYDVGDIDGRVGDRLSSALRLYQQSIEAPPDGYPTLALLRKMRKRG